MVTPPPTHPKAPAPGPSPPVVVSCKEAAGLYGAAAHVGRSPRPASVLGSPEIKFGTEAWPEERSRGGMSGVGRTRGRGAAEVRRFIASLGRVARARADSSASRTAAVTAATKVVARADSSASRTAAVTAATKVASRASASFNPLPSSRRASSPLPSPALSSESDEAPSSSISSGTLGTLGSLTSTETAASAASAALAASQPGASLAASATLAARLGSVRRLWSRGGGTAVGVARGGPWPAALVLTMGEAGMASKATWLLIRA